MGKLIFTENGRTIIRNFSMIRKYDAQGLMSKPREFNGLVILECGEPERPLEFLTSQARNRHGEPVVTVFNVLMFALGAASVMVLDALGASV